VTVSRRRNGSSQQTGSGDVLVQLVTLPAVILAMFTGGIYPQGGNRPGGLISSAGYSGSIRTW